LARRLAEIRPLAARAEVVHQAQVAQDLLEAWVGVQIVFVRVPDQEEGDFSMIDKCPPQRGQRNVLVAKVIRIQGYRDQA
jgi:hypothetical protein